MKKTVSILGLEPRSLTYTTIEQSKNLVSLGILEVLFPVANYRDKDKTPKWSFQKLVDLCPERILKDGNFYILNFDRLLGRYNMSYKALSKFEGSKLVYPEDAFEAESWRCIDVAVETLKFLLENNIGLNISGSTTCDEKCAICPDNVVCPKKKEAEEK